MGTTEAPIELRSEKPNGLIARIRIDAYGSTAGETELMLLNFATECDKATGRPTCAYGEQVIERNMDEPYGSTFAFKGRLILHPDLGMEPFVPTTKLRAELDKRD